MKLSFGIKIFLFCIGWTGLILIGASFALSMEKRIIPIIELSCPDSDSLQTRVWELENLYGEVHLDRIRIMNQLVITEAELHATKFKIHGRDFDDLNEVIR